MLRAGRRGRAFPQFEPLDIGLSSLRRHGAGGELAAAWATGGPFDPAAFGLPAVASSFDNNYDYPLIALVMAVLAIMWLIFIVKILLGLP